MAIMCEILTGGAFGAAHHTIAAKAVLMKVAFLQYYNFAGKHFRLLYCSMEEKEEDGSANMERLQEETLTEQGERS